MQELIDEEASRPEKTIASGDEQLRVQLHNATIADEAWHVKLIASEDERIAELQRYVARVVQYLSYCICGQHADQLLSRIKGSKFAVLLRRYNECIKVMKWAEHNPFLEAQLIEALIRIFTQAGNHPIMETAEAM